MWPSCTTRRGAPLLVGALALFGCRIPSSQIPDPVSPAGGTEHADGSPGGPPPPEHHPSVVRDEAETSREGTPLRAHVPPEERFDPRATPTGGGCGTGHCGSHKKPPVLKLRYGNPTVAGDSSPEVIRRVVNTHLGELRRCHGSGPTDQPANMGAIKLSWVVLPDGSVERTQVLESTIRAPDVGTCMMHAIESWSFPKPRDGKPLEISQRFTFVIE